MDCFKIMEFLSVAAGFTTDAISNVRVYGNENEFDLVSTIQVNTFGATSIDMELQYSIDGINWATSVDILGNPVVLTGVSDAGMPFMFNLKIGRPRYYRIVFANPVGSPNIEVWKT